MGSHLNGKQLSREFVLRKTFPPKMKLWDDCIEEETRMESKGNREGGDNDHALIGQTKKGRGKGPNKGKGKSEEPASHPRKDLNKIKCFICHKNGHYASQCMEKKKGKREAATPGSSLS
jgi:hypothetical protein